MCLCVCVYFMLAVQFQGVSDALCSPREKCCHHLFSVVKLLTLLTDLPAPLLWAAQATGEIFFGMQNCSVTILAFSLAFLPTCLMSAPFFRPSRQPDCCCTLVCSPLPFTCYSGSFNFFLNFLALSFYNCSIWINSFYPLLLEPFLKKACPFLFLLYCFKERKAHTTFEDKNAKFENNAEHNAFYPHCVGRKEVNRSPVLHSTFEEYQG